MTLPSVFRTQTFPWANEGTSTAGVPSPVSSPFGRASITSPLQGGGSSMPTMGVTPGAIIDFNKSTQFSPFKSQYDNAAWSLPQLQDYMTQAKQSAWNEAQASAGGYGKPSGSGIGLAAYGFKGTTGLASQKGSAKYGLQTPMWSALTAANAAMKRAGLGSFGITDGFRSYQGQVAAKAKWTAKGKPNMAATPGRSIHGLGLASDLSLNAAQYNWLIKNGSKYGLVNLPSERWHWQLAPSVWAQSQKKSVGSSKTQTLK